MPVRLNVGLPLDEKAPLEPPTSLDDCRARVRKGTRGGESAPPPAGSAAEGGEPEREAPRETPFRETPRLAGLGERSGDLDGDLDLAASSSSWCESAAVVRHL